MISEEHQHRDKDRSQDRPLCGAGRNEEVDAARHQDDADDHAESGEACSCKSIGPADRNDGAKLGPVEQCVELSADEAEHDVGSHVLHLVDHGLVDVLRGLELTGAESEDDTGDREEEEQDRDQALQQRRADERAAAVLSDLRQRSDKVADEDEDEVQERCDSGLAEAGLHLGIHLFQLRDLDAGVNVRDVLAETLVNDRIADAADDDGAEEGGADHEEPVTGNVDVELALAQEAVQNGVRDALQQGVRSGDHQVRGESCLSTGVAVDHTDDRVLAGADVKNSCDRRNDDHCGIGCQVSDGTDECDNERKDDRRDVAELIVQQSDDEARLLAHTDSDGHGQHQAQRCKACEVLDHVIQEPQKSFTGNGVLDRNDFVGRRVHSGKAHRGKNCADDCDDDEQIEEHDGRNGQLVTCPLQEIQEPVKPGSFRCSLGTHTMPPFRFVAKRSAISSASACPGIPARYSDRRHNIVKHFAN